MKTAMIIPTWKAMPWLHDLLPALKTLDPAPDRILFIDSSSPDDTRKTIEDAGFEVHQIPKEEFGHGKTRNLGAKMCEGADILFYLTQDAIPNQTDLLSPMLKIFEDDPKTAVAFGRQLPHYDANIAASYARLHNYPPESRINTWADIDTRGIKAVFCSNSFSAYRADVLKELGGFPEELPLAEDMGLSARALEAGYNSRYVAEAAVRHSHNYSMYEDFTRYFDIGAFLAVDHWFKDRHIKSGGEGLNFVKGEFKYTYKNGNLWDCIKIVPQTAAKLIGFKLGSQCKKIPVPILRKLSMHSYYWENM